MAEVDIERIDELSSYASGDNFNIQGLIKNLEIPEDPQFGKLSMGIVDEAVGNILTCRKKLYNQLKEIVNNYKNLENSIGGPPGLAINIGDATTMVDGMRYTEASNGDGDFGVIGEIPWRQASNNYVIVGVACYVDGRLVSTDYENGTNIDDIRRKIAKENGIDVSKVEVQVATSLDGDKDTGWINYDELKSVQPQKDMGNSLEDAFDNIDKKFKNNNIKIENKNAEIKVQNYDFTNETASFSATLGESAMKEGVALVRTPLNVVTGAADIATNIVTLGNGTHLRKYENKALDEVENFWEEGFEEKRSSKFG